MTSRGKTPLVVWLAAALYILSTQKFFVRDALSNSTGPQGFTEAALLAAALLLVFACSLRSGRILKPSPSTICFMAFGLFALLSSANSFWPQFSIVKALLFLVVLAFAHLSNGICESAKFLRSLYFCYVAILCIGFMVGVFASSSYPLFFVDDFSGRTRLSLFSTFPGTQGEVAAIMFLVGRIGTVRAPWYCQLFLVIINIGAAGKTSTGILLAVLSLGVLFQNRSKTSWIRFGAIASLAITLLIVAGVISLYTFPSVADRVVTQLQGLYGTKVIDEASSLDGRSDLWDVSLTLLPHCIWLGFGFDGARDFLMRAIPWSGQTHNSMLEVILTAGAFGTIFFLAGWFVAAKACFGVAIESRVRLISIHIFIAVVSLTGILLIFPSNLCMVLFVSCNYLAATLRGKDCAAKVTTCPDISTKPRIANGRTAWT